MRETQEQRVDQLLPGVDAALQRVKSTLLRVAPSKIAVLIEGESGTGKELAAHVLHSLSGRTGAFVPVNVCAVSDSMFEDAFFGHVRGAFTGAQSQVAGILSEANNGTLFLDELSGLQVRHQLTLLRAIETGSYRAIGASGDARSDFRVLSASNEPTTSLIERGALRRDLMHRLGGIVIRMPPLRARRGDIALLAAIFAGEHLHASGDHCRLVPLAVRRLEHHDWPGNVRELRQLVSSAAILSHTSHIALDVVNELLTVHDESNESARRRTDRVRDLARVAAALEAAEGDAQLAGGLLGASRATVYRRARALGLDVGTFRPRPRVAETPPVTDTSMA